MTDQTKTNIFLLNWLACSAAIITVIVLSLNVTKVARNHADLVSSPAYVEMY